MTDLASLVLAVDSTQVKTGTASLDGLTAAGARAEASVKGVGTASATAGVAAAQMARQAQMSASAAVGMATGMKSTGMAANNARIAMLDMTHVGINMTQMLASGVSPMRALVMESGRLATAVQYSAGGITGLVKQTAEWLGIIKVTRDAEIAETAASAAASAAAVRGAVQRAAANVAAIDTEIELAAAAQRVAVTSTEATAATARLAAAYEAAALAARELAAAENALAAAQGRATVAAAADAQTTVVGLSAKGAVITASLAGAAIAGGVLLAAFKALQAQVRSDHTLDNYANSLGLTKKEMKDLRQEVGGLSSKEMKDLENRARAFQITWGDVFHGLAKTAADALDLSPAWQNFKKGVADAFTSALSGAAGAAAAMYGYWVGAYRTIVQTFGGLPQMLGHAFASAANAALGSIEGLVNKSIDAVNSFANGANAILGKAGLGPAFGTAGHVDLGRVKDEYGKAGGVAGKSFGENVADATAEAQTKIAANVQTIYDNIIGAAEKRIKSAADTIIEDRTPKKAKKPGGDHGLADALAELDAQIRGQWRLAQAYQVSDVAAIKAEALQKAEEQAIRHKGEVGIFYEKELALAVAGRAADGAKVIADLRFEAAARERVNDAVAAGLVPASQASAALQLEETLRPLVAAAAVAEGAAKQKILNIIRDLTKEQAKLNVQLSREQYLRELAANDNDLEKLRLEKTLLGASNRERAIAIAQLEAMQRLRDMPGLSAAEQAKYLQQAATKASESVLTPFEQWAATVPQTADAVNEALQSIATKGFDNLASSLTEVIMGTKSLGAAFKDIARSIIADLIQMTIRMLIFKAVTAIFGAKDGAVFGGGFAKGGAFAGGNVIPFAGGGVVTQPTLFPMSGGRVGVMGEKEPEAVMPLARDPQGRLGVRAANSNAPQQIEIVIHSAPSEDAWAKVANISVHTVRGAAPAIVRAARQDTTRALSRPKLMGR